jgi:hypothetical protein
MEERLHDGELFYIENCQWTFNKTSIMRIGDAFRRAAKRPRLAFAHFSSNNCFVCEPHLGIARPAMFINHEPTSDCRRVSKDARLIIDRLLAQRTMSSAKACLRPAPA